jgi:hypothetical protein
MADMSLPDGSPQSITAADPRVAQILAMIQAKAKTAATPPVDATMQTPSLQTTSAPLNATIPQQPLQQLPLPSQPVPGAGTVPLSQQSTPSPTLADGSQPNVPDTPLPSKPGPVKSFLIALGGHLASGVRGGQDALLHDVGLPTSYEKQQNALKMGMQQQQQNSLEGLRQSQGSLAQSKADQFDTLNQPKDIAPDDMSILPQFRGLKGTTVGEYQTLQKVSAGVQSKLDVANTVADTKKAVANIGATSKTNVANIGAAVKALQVGQKKASGVEGTPAELATAIAQGHIPLDRMGYLLARNPGLIQNVMAVDPTFDGSKAQSYPSTYKDFTSGKTSIAINAGGTVLQHLLNLRQLNTTESRIPGTADYQRYQNQVDTIAPELGKFYGNDTIPGIAAYKKTLGAIFNRDAAITQQAHSMGVKLDNYQQQWNNAAPSNVYQAPMPGISATSMAARAALDPEYKVPNSISSPQGGGDIVYDDKLVAHRYKGSGPRNDPNSYDRVK